MKSFTRERICSSLRLATGCGVVTNSNPGKPYTPAMACAVTVNESVQMLTVGTPARSSTIPSAKLAALQEPQSPMPANAKSQLRKICWVRLSSTGVPK
jgi:hypothetical protein